MQGIHNIVIACDRIVRCFVYTLRPVRGTDKNDCFFVICPDDGDNLFRIGLDFTPADSTVGFVADLVDNIVVIFIFFGHFTEELLGLFFIYVRVLLLQYMPVDNHVHIIIGSILYTAIDDILQVFLVTIGAVTAIFVGIHGKTHDIDIPLLTELPECILIYEVGEPGQTVGTDASQLYGIAVLVYQLCAVHGKCTTAGGYCQIGGKGILDFFFFGSLVSVFIRDLIVVFVRVLGGFGFLIAVTLSHLIRIVSTIGIFSVGRYGYGIFILVFPCFGFFAVFFGFLCFGACGVTFQIRHCVICGAGFLKSDYKHNYT